LQLKKARVRWFLSINAEHLPSEQKEKGQRTFRSITVDGDEIETFEGFADVHTESYRDILAGGGFGIEEARPAVETVYQIRNAEEVPLEGDFHHLCRQFGG